MLSFAFIAAWDKTGWGFGGLPAVNFNSDEGFGFGVVASAYRYNGETKPYKTAINGVFFLTTLGIHNHNLEVDTLELADLPLRLTVRGEFNATRTSNFCGFGPEVTCDPADAEAVADAVGATSVARDELVRRYYRTRFISPMLRADARWMLDDLPHRVELLAGWRGVYLQPGDFGVSAPFPNSRYAELFPEGERGFTSVLQVGVMVDNRDNEPAPTRGYWVEGTVRAATPAWGSDDTYVGANTTLRGYLPLFTERLVLADRLMFDGLAGDATTLELVTPGGTQRMQFFGHLNAGRGIRLRRYVGRVKLMDQTELRWTAWSPRIGQLQLDVGLLGFVDVGFVALQWSDVGRMFQTPLVGSGGGLRIAFDKNFIVRADVGVSAVEDWSPSVYIDLRNLF